MESNDEMGTRCRCGKNHSGPYGHYDFWHHNCFHDDPLVWIQGMLTCMECGKVFSVVDAGNLIWSFDLVKEGNDETTIEGPGHETR